MHVHNPDMSRTALHWLALFAAAALVSPSALSAEKNLLYKCVDAAGVTSIQSVACPSGSTQVWARDATPEPELTPEQAALAEAKLRRDQQTVREQVEIVDRKMQALAAAKNPPEAAAPAAPEPAELVAPTGEENDACTSAQIFAASFRDKQWLGLTDEQVRRLYVWVAEQCKSPAKPN